MTSNSFITNACSEIYIFATSYSTVRLAKVQSFKVALIFRLIQVVIIGYIIGYTIIYEKGYQQIDTVSSAVTSKVKGLGFLVEKGFEQEIVKIQNQNFYFSTNYSNDTIRIFDTADYVVPPSEYNSIFIMTNFIETRQTQSKCEEDYTSVANSICKTDADCKAVIPENSWSGIPTGRCIQSIYNETLKVCEISSWCPVEREDETNLIKNVENFTIFIKNDVLFPAFSRKLRNLVPNITNSYISKCAYLPRSENPYCPVFRVGDILNEAEPNKTEQSIMMERGAVIQINIKWECNFDSKALCMPHYSFARFDLSSSAVSAATGFNFRFADKFEVDGTMYRVVVKAYGLRFIITVNGKAGKFNLIPLMLSVGAGLGLLSLATIAADIVLVYCTTKRQIYREIKELDVKKSVNNSKYGENVEDNNHIDRV